MSDRAIRILDPAEHRTADAVFAETLHVPAPDDADWQRRRRAYQPGRSFGAFEDAELIGTARSVDVALTVPGDHAIPAAAVCDVGVRAHRTRRGVLRDLMDAQLHEFVERGVHAAVLHASEGGIYGRFGYGVATVERSFLVNRSTAQVRERAPSDGEVELLDFEEAVRSVPEIYAANAANRPGMITRPEYLWPGWEGHFRRAGHIARAAVHRGRDGCDGYAMYHVDRRRRAGHDAEGASTTLHVHDMVIGSHAAFADLWRFLLGVDIVDRIDVDSRPADEPLEVLLTDPQACRVTGNDEYLWLRLVDVPAALASRTYGEGGSVVLGVDDPVLPANSGNYRISGDGVQRTDHAAQLRVDVDALAMLYLGAWRPAALAAVGRIDVIDPAALEVAERMCVTTTQPWCGTHF